MKTKKQEVIYIDKYWELSELIQEHLEQFDGLYDHFNASQGYRNDTYDMFFSVGDQIEDLQDEMYMLKDGSADLWLILEWLAHNGVIEKGDYLISISW